jgi:heme/copper-type cytochrome/quinol oxidase subunit 3
VTAGGSAPPPTKPSPSGSGDGAQVIPHGMFGMVLFVLAEGMLFAGLISAFEIMHSAAMVWPPPDQPRLPIEATAFNTLVLLASGYFLYAAHRAFHRGDRGNMLRPMTISLGLGVFFVLFQGYEWVQLINEGLTLTSSTLGGFFYLMVGVHALHALGAIGLLGYATSQLRKGWLTPSLFGATEVFWFFVVAVWPILYAVVYLR